MRPTVRWSGNRSHMLRALMTGTLLLATLAAPVRTLHGQRGAPARPRPETAVSVTRGKLAWGRLVLGMTAKQVESVLGEGLVFRPSPGGACEGVEADVESQRQRATLTFSPSAADGSLVDIFVPFLAPRDLREVVTALKTQVPTLFYAPGPHEPELPEAKNTKPLYLLRADPAQGILVGPSEGFWISRGCWD